MRFLVLFLCGAPEGFASLVKRTLRKIPLVSPICAFVPGTACRYETSRILEMPKGGFR